MSGIPYGRAPGLKRGGYIDAVDAIAGRVRELPARDNWYLSTVPPYNAGSIGCAALTANLVRFYYLGKLASETTLAQARLNITTLSAGQDVRTAIYVYDNSAERRLVKVAPTEVRFAADATGVQTALLPDNPVVGLGQFFLAIKASDNVLGVAGLAAVAVNRAFPVHTYAGAAGVFPTEVACATLTKDYTGVLLDVLYMSPDAAQVL